MDAPAPEEGQTTEASTLPDELPAAAEEEKTVQEDAAQAGAEEPETLAEASQDGPVPVVQDQAVPAELPDAEQTTSSSSEAGEEPVATSDDIRQPTLLEDDASTLFPLEVQTPLSPEEAVRPFTDFIEEFRQTEAHFDALLNDSETSFSAFVAGSESLQEPVTFLETEPEDLAQAVDVASLSPSQDVPADSLATSEEEFSTPVSAASEVQSRPVTERPVSPLLRPATRPRLPRHGRHRIDDLIHPAELRGDAPKASAPAPTPAPAEEPIAAIEPPAPEEPKPEEQPARPARRYRFDRPAATASATPSATRSATPVTSARPTESKERRNVVAPAEPAASAVTSVETPVARVTTPEAAPAPAEAPTPAPAPTERRRRSNHERAREKEQPVATPVAAPMPEPEPVVEPVQPEEQDVPLEELPPLEYSELQAASSRRRRRRRPGSASTAAAAPSANGVSPSKAALPDLAVPPAPTPAPSVPPLPKTVPPLPPSYNIVSGYTVSQMNQGNDISGPFMGPEPSPARGSTFSTPSARHVRSEVLRSTPPAHPVKQNESPLMSNAAVNHMANVLSQAIQTQTDRMVAELRRANQVPTNVSVSLPPFPSTERVGVFVDVANLLYSARTLRMTVDFGKLLDFLRGNRRLVRAQAYCPTSPQPGDDQMFLQAVKGLGYRITTKNYKTFSSGAKKADLDLDLCMDVVRLVDGKAVDCIVLVSGDSDFMPMLDYCSDHGVRVEVAAFDESMSATLRQSCDLFVNLSMLEEIRA
jgi:uncharacterized LabA/DUF88 family protein